MESIHLAMNGIFVIYANLKISIDYEIQCYCSFDFSYSDGMFW